MLEATYKLKLGQDEFELKATVKDEKELFETMAFYSNLPKTAPNGATDLKMVFRTTKKGHKYYSLISEQEKMEFKLGQNLEANGGGLFCKGWEPLYTKDEDQQADGQQGQVPYQGAQPAPAAPRQAAPLPQAPTINIAPTVPNYAPAAPLPNPNYPGMVNPTTGPTAAQVPTQGAAPAYQPAAAPAQAAPIAAAPTPTPTPAQPNPQVAAQASNVLARFGIKQ